MSELHSLVLNSGASRIYETGGPNEDKARRHMRGDRDAKGVEGKGSGEGVSPP